MTNGQQAHEKVLNITTHQGNANQNHIEIPPHTCSNDLPKIKSSERKEISVDEDVEKREPWHILDGECKLVQPLWRKSMEVTRKTENKTTI